MALLREAIALGVDYVDLEMDIARNIRRFGKTKRIISYHNYKGVPADLEQIAEQCDEMDADVVKVAAMATKVSDASRVLQPRRQGRGPDGPDRDGPARRLHPHPGGEVRGPVHLRRRSTPSGSFAPGMLNFRTLQRDYFYDQIDKETEVYAVIGDPIEQSLSPAIHNAAFRHLGMNKVLVPLLIPDGALVPSLKGLEWLDIKGFSITIPHKEAVLPLLDRKDPSVERTGSCNTMVVRDGKKLGFNTDYLAAMDSLEEAMGGRVAEGQHSPLFEKRVLILGAGGAARTIAHGLAKRGASVTITNRHDDRASRLAEEVGCRSIHWGQRPGRSTR